MNNIDEIVERLDDLIVNSKAIPFSEAVRVNKRDLEEIAYELKLAVPQSVKEAEEVVNNCEDYVSDAKNMAQSIVEQAQMEANRLISEHDVYIRAVDEAERITEATNMEIQQAIDDAAITIDGILSDINEKIENINVRINEQYKQTYSDLKSYLDEIYEMRKELRG